MGALASLTSQITSLQHQRTDVIIHYLPSSKSRATAKFVTTLTFQMASLVGD